MRFLKIGVAAFQGDIEEHVNATREALKRAGVEGDVVLAKTKEEIAGLDALIIPGGESTVMGRLASYKEIFAESRRKVEEGMPVMGTCAGLIILAKRVYDKVVGETRQQLVGVLDVVVERNSYGRQRESFEALIDIPRMGLKDFKAVFIRAPSIVEVSPGVEILASLADKPIAVKQGSVIGTTFHPELSGSTAFHELLISMASERRA